MIAARERAASRSEQGPVSSSSLIVLTAISIACALFVCLFRTPIARGMQLLDLPDKRKRHTSAVPMVTQVLTFVARAEDQPRSSASFGSRLPKRTKS